MGDAKATVELFKIIQSNLEGTLLDELIEEKSNWLSHQVLMSSRLRTFEKPGVYYFYNGNDEVIYIGKSKNIKTRVRSHFRPDMKRKRYSNQSQVEKIDYKVLGSDLAACLFECLEIKAHRQMFNHRMNRKHFLCSSSDPKEKWRINRLLSSWWWRTLSHI